ARLGLRLGDAAREGPAELGDARVARADRLSQLPLLPRRLGGKGGIFALQPTQPLDVGTVRRTDEVRQHMHLAESLADCRVVGARMGEERPIGARYLAASDCGTPPLDELRLRRGGLELAEDELMALIERLVEELRRLVMSPGEPDAFLVQLMVGGVGRDALHL